MDLIPPDNAYVRNASGPCECRLDVARMQGRHYHRGVMETAWDLEVTRSHLRLRRSSSWEPCTPSQRLPLLQEEAPPLLLSMPGSGNTFVRGLLEAATGVLTGSVCKSCRRLQRTDPGPAKAGESIARTKAANPLPLLGTRCGSLAGGRHARGKSLPPCARGQGAPNTDSPGEALSQQQRADWSEGRKKLRPVQPRHCLDARFLPCHLCRVSALFPRARGTCSADGGFFSKLQTHCLAIRRCGTSTMGQTYTLEPSRTTSGIPISCKTSLSSLRFGTPW